VVSYAVTATVEPSLTAAYEQFMREHHIPALLATGCFRAAAFARVAPGHYRMRYDAAAREDLERYLATHAARLRDEFTARFPAGIALEREVSEVLEVWEARSGA
jgi:uncharacterized protein DUF4286